MVRRCSPDAVGGLGLRQPSARGPDAPAFRHALDDPDRALPGDPLGGLPEGRLGSVQAVRGRHPPLPVLPAGRPHSPRLHRRAGVRRPLVVLHLQSIDAAIEQLATGSPAPAPVLWHCRLHRVQPRQSRAPAPHLRWLEGIGQGLPPRRSMPSRSPSFSCCPSSAPPAGPSPGPSTCSACRSCC